MKNKIIVVFIILIVIINIGIGVFGFNLSKVDNKKTNVEINIKNGTSANEIINILDENNLIRSKFFTKVYLKFSNYNLQAGIYELNTSMNTIEILKYLNDGKVTNKYNLRITFNEGLNVRGIAKIISNNTNNKYEDVIKVFEDREYAKKLIDKYWFLTDDILKSGIYYPLEGYLFPDTYEFMNKDVSVDTIITTLLNEFNKKVSPYKEEIENSNYNIHELITLASIAESESLPGADRKNVVSVSVNRMKNGMSLGSDMTAYYAYKLDDYKNGGLTIEQFNNCSSPYNTRCLSKMGLPIGPISNPSLDSIVGAIEYEDTTYLFYIADCSGKTYFTNTYDEFISKINELQQQGKWCEVSREYYVYL